MSGNVPLRSPTPPVMGSNPASKFRTSRSMPSWVVSTTESNDRVGPPPPPPPDNADPEYEVIDVANQQYSNAPPPIPLKSLDIKRMTVMKCDLCGSVTPAVRCEQCDQNLFCASCDDRYHRHPKRQTHTRVPVELQTTAVKPPLPPKGEAGTGGPLPPPRRNKRPGSFHFPSPLLGRKQDQDQTIPTTVPQGPISNHSQKPPQAPPSPALSLRDKMNSLKRFIHPSNRPLPDPPEQKFHSSTSSLDTIPKRSSSVGTNKSVSSTMEKIQNNTAATLDRMNLLQQRYRQHQEAMKQDSDRSRRASLSSNTELQSSVQNIRTKPPSVPSPHHHQQQFHHQHQVPQSRWMEPPTPRIRSGSVASGINLLPSASSVVSNENNTSSNNPPFMSSTQRPDFGASPDVGPPNPRSTSVFNLNQMHQQPPNMWGFNSLQQAQSMAHINQMHWNQMNPWMMGQSQNGSNVSLNIPPSQQGHYPHDQSGYPPGWNNAWGGMYPYPMGMMPMMPGMAMPPPRSRAHSRSRAASPALSIKSRKSTMSMRNMQRSSYINDLTDDEDSDEEFVKTRGRRDRRHRVDSNSSLDFEEPEPAAFIRASSVKHSRFNRDRRGASSARSLIDYPTSQKRETHRSKYDREELLRDRFDKMSLSSPRKVTSDSFTNDSDGESNRRVSSKSKSNNESISSPRKITSDSMTNDSDAEFEKRRLAKQRASSSVSSPKRIASDSFTNDSDAEFERRKQQKLKTSGPGTTSLASAESDTVRDKTKPAGSRKLSDTEKTKPVKSKVTKIAPKKIPSDSHTPDTDGEQKRRFTVKKTVKKHSSTEFIPNDSDEDFDQHKEQNRKNSNMINEPSELKTAKHGEDNDEQDVHMKTVEMKNQINESKSESVEFATEDSPPPAAPIPAPDREWECEFCTYVNEAGVKICAICCKTVTIAIVAAKPNTETPRSPPPDVVQEPPFEKKRLQNPVSDVKKPLTAVPPAKEVDTKKKDNDDEEEVDGDGVIVEESVNYNENYVEENQYENHEIRKEPSVQMNPEYPKDSGEIKENLDSEVVKVVKKVVTEKISTGCGPSPPRELDTQKESTILQDSRQLSPSRASIGTSPPPQDMSTQTYETFEKAREDISAGQAPAADKPVNNLTQPQSGSSYKRSYSLATPQLLQVGSPRPSSRQSFSSDTQSLPPTPHELSPQPRDAFQHQQNDHQDPSHHRDESMSYLDRAIHQIIQTAAKTTFSTSRPLEQNKYRAMNDLRRIDVIQQTHPTINNLLHKRQTTTNTTVERSEDATPTMQTLKISEQENSAGTELVSLLKEAERYKFTAEELQAALSHCRDKHPVQWLRDNWSKLIDTVQTLATKYGHEKRENTIGTISSIEAREALRLHKGNIWHAITECIEQRQRKYNEIASKGNFTREDIVTSLTAHHGNLEMAMLELSKTQLKPFLMRIWGPPNGADNDSGNLLLQQALKEDRSGISSEIQEFISAHVEKELLSESSAGEEEAVSSTEVRLEECHETTNHSATNGKCELVEEESIPSNTVILRDIEKLIDQMEKNQANQNDEVLKNIQQLLTKLVERNGSRPASQASVRSDSCERIITKSPIPLPRSNQPSLDETKPVYEDIRKFMAENIQEILPSLVDQVQQELENVPLKTDKSLEDDIKETLMNAEYSEEDLTTIHSFPFKKDIETEYDFPNLKHRASLGFKTALEEETEYANIEDFLRRAIRSEKLTNEFERYKVQNYRLDSSSDEARMTAESDYYDIVAVSQRIQDILNGTRTDVMSEQATVLEKDVPFQPPEATAENNNTEEAIYVNTIEMAAMKATIPASDPVEKRQGKKRRVSRIPVNKNNYHQRRPVKSSSESDFEVLTRNHRSPIPTVHVDHVEELRHVVDNIEKIDHELEIAPDEADVLQIETDQPIYDNIMSNTEPTVVENQVFQEPITEASSNDHHEKVFDNNNSESQTVELHEQNYANIGINVPKNVNDATDRTSPEVHDVINEEVPAPPNIIAQSTISHVDAKSPTPPKNPNVTTESIIPTKPESVPQPLPSPPKSPIEATAVQSPPKNPSIPQITESTAAQVTEQTTDQQTINDETVTQQFLNQESNEETIKLEETTQPPSKSSNNLSELVLDTKRLIQQMKDEIASDMATMADEEVVYDDEYYEGDEYEDWSEGEENIEEEWDSNEEYDIDENGDYYEYEDEDDDGSVMFSEIAPEDVAHPDKQTSEPIEHIDEKNDIDKPDLPKISADLVREIERNSASEVSDLPLDSDFNDALSVIEQSVGEIRDILSMAVGALSEGNQEYDESSSAETMQNSPDTSEISEVTLVADGSDVTEPTLVAEENIKLTIKNVQSLLNAKAVIGDFIKTAQIIESIDTNAVLVEAGHDASNAFKNMNESVELETMNDNSPIDNQSNTAIDVNVPEMQAPKEENHVTNANETESSIGLRSPTTEQTIPQQEIAPAQGNSKEKAPDVIPDGAKVNTIPSSADNEAMNATHALDATIEMLNSVARDLSEQLRQVSPVLEKDELLHKLNNLTIHEVNPETLSQSTSAMHAIEKEGLNKETDEHSDIQTPEATIEIIVQQVTVEHAPENRNEIEETLANLKTSTTQDTQLGVNDQPTTVHLNGNKTEHILDNTDKTMTHDTYSDTVVQPAVPEYATVSKDKTTGSLDIINTEQQEKEMHLQENGIHEYINVTEIKAMLAESGNNSQTQQHKINGYKDEDDSSESASMFDKTIPDYATVVRVNKKPQLIEVDVLTSQKVDINVGSVKDETLTDLQINSEANPSMSERTENQPDIVTSTGLSNANKTDLNAYGELSTTVDTVEINQQMTVISDTIQSSTSNKTAELLEDSSMEVLQASNAEMKSNGQDVADSHPRSMDEVNVIASSSDNQPETKETSNDTQADVHVATASVDASEHTLIVEEPKMTDCSSQPQNDMITNIENQSGSNVQVSLTEAVAKHFENSFELTNIKLKDSENPSTVELVKQSAQELTGSTSNDVKTNQTISKPAEPDTSLEQQPVYLAVKQEALNQNEQTYSITNGDLNEQILRPSKSRASSEEPSSIIEVNASQVITHSPSTVTTPSQSLPQITPRSSNIYENVEVTPSPHEDSPKSGKLSIRIPSPSTITQQENNTNKASSVPSTPPTPPTPTGKKKTKTVKTKTKTTTENKRKTSTTSEPSTEIKRKTSTASEPSTETTKRKTSTTSDPPSRRNSLRKTSIGGPFGPVSTNTVKNMQKEFLSKTQNDSSKPVTIAPKPKPSKLVQPKAFTNKPSKTVTPTQPNVAASTSKASTPSAEPGSSRSTPGPSSSKSTPGASREGSVTSEQRRKLRKKYMETCFSDDYITSDEDEDLTTVTESESRTIIRSLVKPFEPSEEPLEVQAQRLLDDGHVQSYQQAELAVQLIEMRYAQDNAIWAATQCHTIEEAKNLLQKECELCLGTFPMNEIVSMLKCTHFCCLDCAKVYFTEEIMHRSITNCNCPYCKEPDLNNADVTEDDVLEYFSNLDILLKNIVDEEVHDLFQRKLRDRTLMQDPNFKWCVDCSSGFFARPRQKRLICPDCGSITCSSCRKPWESQHEGISCEKFAAWKEANDPELQAQGVARHLQAHGISCPNCKFKYSLSRGGCMHFTCTQCKYEFCFGCNKPFMMGAKCDVSPYCAKLGLHAHHPRNCLFYLRDKDPRDLQTLLTMHNVTYDTEPSELMKREFMEGENATMKCPVLLQKETPAGLMDTVCNGEVPEAYAGLCRTHYVEYLVGAVSKAQIDPLPILDLTDCVQELRRRGIPLPERGPWDTDEIYREMCQKIVKEQIPLN